MPSAFTLKPSKDTVTPHFVPRQVFQVKNHPQKLQSNFEDKSLGNLSDFSRNGAGASLRFADSQNGARKACGRKDTKFWASKKSKGKSKNVTTHKG
jgi:hypothetical protein